MRPQDYTTEENELLTCQVLIHLADLRLASVALRGLIPSIPTRRQDELDRHQERIKTVETMYAELDELQAKHNKHLEEVYRNED